MKYGVFDTQDNCWLGDDSGPKLFDDFAIARIASQVYSDQLYGTDLIFRLEAREYDGSGTIRGWDEALREVLKSYAAI